MKGKTCCVTGHRDLPQNEINKVKAALEQQAKGLPKVVAAR